MRRQRSLQYFLGLPTPFRTNTSQPHNPQSIALHEKKRPHEGGLVPARFSVCACLAEATSLQNAFPRMAASADRLEIAVVECRAAVPYRDDVINGIGRGDLSASRANAAERLFVEMAFPSRAPPAARVEPMSRISGATAVIFSPYLNPVAFASAVTGINERCASRIAAGMFRSNGTHLVCLALTGDVDTGCLRVSFGCSLIGSFPFSMT